jgi:hypothetical protein
MPAAGAYGSKARYRQADAPCTLSPTADGFALDFDAAHPQWAVTPGQSAVLYDGEVCLGGGVIESAMVPALDAALAAQALEPRRPALREAAAGKATASKVSRKAVPLAR